MPILEPAEWRRLKLFAWFLLLIDGCIVGIGFLLGRTLDSRRDAWILIGAVAFLVNFAFVLVVGGNVLLVLLSHWRHGPRDNPPD